MSMVCSGCQVPITPHTKYLCVYLSPIGFNLAIGCYHFTPPAGWNHVFGGAACFHRWLEEFEDNLKTCKHNGDHYDQLFKVNPLSVLL